MTTQNSKTALVTGASQRIGRAIAISMAADGWQIAVHYNTSAADANKVVQEISEAGGKAIAVPADLADETAVSALIPDIGQQLGPVSAVINNASIFEEDTVETATKHSWDSHMAINLRAPFLLTQGLAENRPKNEKANIINIVDQRVKNLTPYFSSYTLSKSALWTLTQTSAAALAPDIRVNAIGPGPTLPSVRQSQEQFDRQVALTPLQAQVDPEEICQAVRFILATPSMTGQLLALDSGQHLGWAQPGQPSQPDE
jgi:NAD(P)-dependent dehydrogenase (short-subunit alcohol dehydrogenase family)